MIKKTVLQIFLMTFVFSICAAALPIINFEGYAPGTVITNQFQTSHGITFSSPHSLQVWKRGDNSGGYFSGVNRSGNTVNQPATLTTVGDYYLGTNQNVSGSQNFSIHYISSVAKANGTIIDLESTEKAIFTAYDINNNILETFTWTGSVVGGEGGNSLTKYNLI